FAAHLIVFDANRLMCQTGKGELTKLRSVICFSIQTFEMIDVLVREEATISHHCHAAHRTMLRSIVDPDQSKPRTNHVPGCLRGPHCDDPSRQFQLELARHKAPAPTAYRRSNPMAP